MRVAALFLLVTLSASHIHAEDETPALDKAPAEQDWIYSVRFAKDLSKVHVRVVFHGYLPKRVVLIRPDALAAVTVHADGRAHRRDAARGSIMPDIRAAGDALRYTVDLRTLARITRSSRLTQFVGRDVVTRAGLFLLHPARWPKHGVARLIFESQPGLERAVPWARDQRASADHRQSVYRVPRHAMAPHARIAFGRFRPKVLRVAGGDMVYSILDAPHRTTNAGVRQWLTTAMATVADLFDGPPVPRTHVIVQPLVPGRGRPIVYGRATLSGGPLLHVMLSGTTTDDRMPGEWLTIHELIHLGMPVTTNADRWFGEGFVSYYQEVLRARAGIITPHQAWQNLHNWMERGRTSGGQATLAIESRKMTNTYAYHRVYWGGAAIALKMDVAIRTQTAGRYTLDDVMRHFHGRFRIPGTSIDALVLMRHADALIGKSICEPMARKALASGAFPDLRATNRRLGLRYPEGRIEIVASAPASQHRRAIMRRGGR